MTSFGVAACHQTPSHRVDISLHGVSWEVVPKHSANRLVYVHLVAFVPFCQVYTRCAQWVKNLAT